MQARHAEVTICGAQTVVEVEAIGVTLVSGGSGLLDACGLVDGELLSGDLEALDDCEPLGTFVVLPLTVTLGRVTVGCPVSGTESSTKSTKKVSLVIAKGTAEEDEEALLELTLPMLELDDGAWDDAVSLAELWSLSSSSSAAAMHTLDL